MKKIFFCSLVFIAAKSLAQDPTFTQYYSSGLQMNPAFAGAYANPVFNFLYRSHWPSVSRNFNEYTVSYNHYINKLKSGIGLYYMNETDGEVYKTQSYHFDFSPSIFLDSNWVLKPALEIAYVNKIMEVCILSGPWYCVDTIGKIEYADFTSGILLYHKQFDFGFVIHHLFEPDERLFTYNESPLPRKFIAHTSYNFPLNEKKTSFFSPAIIYKIQQDYRELNLSLAYKITPLILGISYGNKDSWSARIGLDNGKFRVSYSYDITVSKLRNAAAGSHEFFVSHIIPGEKLRNKKPALNRVAF